MLRNTLLFTFSLMLTYSGQAQSQHYLDYIKKYQNIAVKEMERSGIPASIKLAQGILESNAGRSDLARRANNHFGVKCGNDWSGKTIWKKDDDYDERGKLQESCFRAYRNAEASFRAHSEFLLDPAKQWRYGSLFQLDPTDYRRWAIGLKRSGYATSANYHTKLISLIETYKLYEYDQMISNQVLIAEKPTAPLEGAVLTNNDVKYVLALEGEDAQRIAQRTGVTLSSLLRYNDHVQTADQRLSEGVYVYLQPLRGNYRGKDAWHEVKDNERMIDIALTYAIDLKKLYRRNRLSTGSEPASGQRIKLKGSTVKTAPKLRDPSTLQKENLIELPIEITGGEPQKETPPAKPVEPTLPETKVEQPQQPPIQPQPTTPTEPKTETAQTNGKDEERAFPDWKPFEIDEKEEEEFIWEEEENKSEQLIFKPGVKKPVDEKPTTVANQTDDTAKPQPINTSTSAQYHEVKKGDTLWNISKRYNTTVDAIKKLNDLQTNEIGIGKRLRVK